MITRLAKIFFAFIFVVTVSSCDRKSCKNVSCPVGQSCNNGQCFCTDGYEGTECQVNSFEKYVDNNRSWNVVENCNGTIPNFSNFYVSFQHYSSNPSEIEIIGLLGGSCSIIGYIRTDQSNQGNILEINGSDCYGNPISGRGTYYASPVRIILELSYSWSGISYNCTHTYYPS